jgi:hypothetical protein
VARTAGRVIFSIALFPITKEPINIEVAYVRAGMRKIG